MGMFELILQCGLLVMVAELLRRVVRLETRVGMCALCPVTVTDVLVKGHGLDAVRFGKHSKIDTEVTKND